MRKIIKDQKGQTFIIMFLLMLIALTIGIAMSGRFVRTLKRVSRTDEITRAHFSAEAGLEKFLDIPILTLEDYIIYNNCGTDCVIQTTDDLGRLITTTIELSFIGETDEAYRMDLTQNDTQQVFLGGYTSGTDLDICWDGGASVYTSYVYEDSGDIKQDTYAYNSSTYFGVENNFDTALPNYTYLNCYSVTANGDPTYLRLKSYYQDATVYIVPTNGQNIPRQGILIEATSKVGETVKKVSAIRKSSMLPGMFDYVLYQKSPTDTLSN
jgi:hypothetical protein